MKPPRESSWREFFCGARVIKVIVTDNATRGRGTDADPVRVLRQIWTLDGQLIVEIDEWANEQVRKRVQEAP